jgi:multicomponent Na+:H+ antiporter subunit B
MPETLINDALLGLLAVLALGLLLTRSLFAKIVLLSIYSLLSAGLFVTLDAVDVAFTEAAVGAGISTLLFVAALARTKPRDRPLAAHPILAVLAALVTGIFLIYGTLDMPRFGDPDAPVHQHVAPYYLQQSREDIGIPNVVTSVLASYRGYDTLGEVTVIFTAGVGVLALIGGLRRRKEPED